MGYLDQIETPILKQPDPIVAYYTFVTYIYTNRLYKCLINFHHSSHSSQQENRFSVNLQTDFQLYPALSPESFISKILCSPPSNRYQKKVMGDFHLHRKELDEKNANNLFLQDNLHQFLNLIERLSSPYEKISESDESLFAAVKRNHMRDLVYFISSHLQSQTKHTSLHCAKVLHLLVHPRDTLFSEILPSIEQELNTALLTSLTKCLSLKSEISQILTCTYFDLSDVLKPNNQWALVYSDILKGLMQPCNDVKLLHRAIILFPEMSSRNRVVFLDQVDSLSNGLKNLMMGNEDCEVNGDVACAIMALIMHLTEPASCEKYYDDVARIMDVLSMALDAGHDIVSRKVLEGLKRLTGMCRGVLLGKIDEVVETMLYVFHVFQDSNNVKDGIKNCALDILLNLADSTDSGSPLIRLSRVCLARLFRFLTNTLTNKDLAFERQVSLIKAINKCILVQMSRKRMNDYHMKKFVDWINKRFKGREKELLEDKIEKDDELYREIGHCIITCIQDLKAEFLPYFDQLLPYLAPIWGKDYSTNQRMIALCICSEVAEQCSEEAFTRYENQLNNVLKECDLDDPDNWWTIAQGIRIAVKFGGKVFNRNRVNVLCILRRIIGHPNVKLPHNVMAYETCVVAFGKMCYDHPELYNIWLRYLPLENNFEEAKIAHQDLCSLIEKPENIFLGHKCENMGKVMNIFVKVLSEGDKLATEDTTTRMKELIRQFKNTVGFNTVVSSILIEARNLLLDTIML